jgi:hypothetical protein
MPSQEDLPVSPKGGIKVRTPVQSQVKVVAVAVNRLENINIKSITGLKMGKNQVWSSAIEPRWMKNGRCWIQAARFVITFQRISMEQILGPGLGPGRVSNDYINLSIHPRNRRRKDGGGIQEI